jgi:hypothetical protein
MDISSKMVRSWALGGEDAGFKPQNPCYKRLYNEEKTVLHHGPKMSGFLLLSTEGDIGPKNSPSNSFFIEQLVKR